MVPIPSRLQLDIARNALGLVEAFVYGLFSGIVFGPIYNVFNAQSS